MHLYCIILHCTILYCAILYCIILYCIPSEYHRFLMVRWLHGPLSGAIDKSPAARIAVKSNHDLICAQPCFRSGWFDLNFRWKYSNHLKSNHVDFITNPPLFLWKREVGVKKKQATTIYSKLISEKLQMDISRSTRVHFWRFDNRWKAGSEGFQTSVKSSKTVR